MYRTFKYWDSYLVHMRWNSKARRLICSHSVTSKQTHQHTRAISYIILNIIVTICDAHFCSPTLFICSSLSLNLSPALSICNSSIRVYASLCFHSHNHQVLLTTGFSAYTVYTCLWLLAFHCSALNGSPEPKNFKNLDYHLLFIGCWEFYFVRTCSRFTFSHAFSFDGAHFVSVSLAFCL